MIEAFGQLFSNLRSSPDKNKIANITEDELPVHEHEEKFNFDKENIQNKYCKLTYNNNEEEALNFELF